MTAHYRHLSLEDRIEIEQGLDRGPSRAEIARRLGVHHSTITRELRRGSWQPEHDHANLRPYLRNKLDTRGPHERLYLAGQAQLRAEVRTAHSHEPFRMKYDRLLSRAITQLRKGWSVEEIAGRIRIEFPSDLRMRVSAETLYAWIYDSKQQHRELSTFLVDIRSVVGRRVVMSTGDGSSGAPRFMIGRLRSRIGSSSDTGNPTVSSAAHGTGGIHTTVERTSRYYQAIKIPQVAARPTVDAQIELFSTLPAHAVRSVTADNGSEFAFHYELADALAVPTYFADPYSAYQRGSNEHFNGRLRRYLPKGTSFEDLTQDELNEFVNEINNRPRKILGWATPAEIFHELAWELTPTTRRCTSD